jgi:hypothetical protein
LHYFLSGFNPCALFDGFKYPIHFFISLSLLFSFISVLPYSILYPPFSFLSSFFCFPSLCFSLLLLSFLTYFVIPSLFLLSVFLLSAFLFLCIPTVIRITNHPNILFYKVSIVSSVNLSFLSKNVCSKNKYHSCQTCCIILMCIV